PAGPAETGMEAGSDQHPTAEQAFERLKNLAGTWNGEAAGEGRAEEEEVDGFTVSHTFQVSANDSVVMETMNPGTDHEMINMYHRDGEDLVLTHYCAGGNQPTMKMDRAKSSADDYVFEFTGGTNLDPAVDPHIHAGGLKFVDDDQIESRWISHQNGEQAGVMVFHLQRAEG
ncbi:MAG: hypothetical protein SX243_15875, partial [Acidobacteriota bacterium]|nr:hypothetical protein [Acidobacteriota bacterium]